MTAFATFENGIQSGRPNRVRPHIKWTPAADRFLLALYREGKSVRYIARKMGRSQTSIIMRLGKLGE